LLRHYWEILSTTFDEEYSSVVGMPVKMLKIVISVLLAFYITVTIRAVGTLMMEALLVIPGACGITVDRFLPHILEDIHGFNSRFWGS